MKSTITTAIYYLCSFTVAIFILSSCAVEYNVPMKSKPNTQYINEGEYIKSKQ